MPGGSIERRRRRFIFIAFFILLPLLYILKVTLPHQTIHYAMDSIQGYTKTNYTHNLQQYLIPIAPLVATALPGDPLINHQAAPTKGVGYGTSHNSQEATLPSVGKSLVSTPASGDSRSSNTALGSSFEISLSLKVAVIVENRIQKKLIPLILHFASVLGPEWPIVIYTSTESVGMFSASAAFNRFRKSGRIQIRLLPITVLFTNSNSVNAFFTKPW